MSAALIAAFFLVGQSLDAAAEHVMRATLDARSAAHEMAGYVAMPAEDRFANLREGDAGETWTLSLQGGVTYLFQGVCDSVCTNADIDVRNAYGEQIAEDINGDALPVISITPPRAGQYTLRLWLKHCRAAACAAAVRTYRRSAAQ